MWVCGAQCSFGNTWAWHPPVGVWIGILGLLGVIVPLIRDINNIGRREKAVWTLVMFSLLLLEIKSVYQDRNEHDLQQAEARASEERNFEAIASGIKESIAESDRNFTETMSGLDASVKTSTGGSSFCFIRFVFRGSSAELVLLHQGAYPLADVSVRIFDSDSFRFNTQTQPIHVGTVPVRGSQELTQIVLPDMLEKKYIASFTARNGAWDQLIFLRKDHIGWHFATRVQENIGQVNFSKLARPRRVIYEKPDKGFPGPLPSETVWDSFNGIQTFCLDCD